MSLEKDMARFVDRYTLVYTRLYPHPLERVWRAITDPAEVGVWFLRAKIDLRAGGAYAFGPDQSSFGGLITELEPPRRIRFGAADAFKTSRDLGWFEFMLEPEGTGTRMTFTHHFGSDQHYSETAGDLGGDLPAGPGTPWKPGFVGGFHQMFDHLGEMLAGHEIGSRYGDSELRAIAAEWAKRKVQNDELDPDVAARFVRELRSVEAWNELNKVYREFIRTHCPSA